MATSSARWALVLAAVMLVAVALPSLAAPVKLTINGYVQGRFTQTLGHEGPLSALVPAQTAFDAKRAYLTTNAVVDDHVSASLLISLVTKVSTLEAYAAYTDGPCSARIGLSRIPFGYEIPLSSAGLITLERSQAFNTLVYPATFDRGAYAYYKPASGLNFAVGVTNGRPAEVDPKATPAVPLENNNEKNVIARAGYKFGKSQVGVSYMTGELPFKVKLAGTTYDPSVADTDTHFMAFDIQAQNGPFTILSEGISGTLKMEGTATSTKTKGVYVTAAYRNGEEPSQPYVRYDVFDPDTATTGDYFRRLTVGYNHYLNPNTKLTAEYQWVSDDLQPDLKGYVAGQYQVTF